MTLEEQLAIAILVIVSAIFLLLCELYRKVRAIYFTTDCPKIYAHASGFQVKSLLP